MFAFILFRTIGKSVRFQCTACWSESRDKFERNLRIVIDFSILSINLSEWKFEYGALSLMYCSVQTHPVFILENDSESFGWKFVSYIGIQEKLFSFPGDRAKKEWNDVIWGVNFHDPIDSLKKVDKFGTITICNRELVSRRKNIGRMSCNIHSNNAFVVKKLVELLAGIERCIMCIAINTEGLHLNQFCMWCISTLQCLPLPMFIMFGSVLSSAYASSFRSFRSLFLSIARYAWMCLWFKAEIYTFRMPDDYDD